MTYRVITTFEYNGSQIIYRTVGVGKPVIFLHGFGEDGSIFNYQIDFLKEHCLLIIPDLPGSGKSEILQSNIHHPVSNIQFPEASITDYAKCIHALLQKENIEVCTMIGHSMGGYITLTFAELYPEMLNGFGFIHSTAFADSEEKKQNRLRGIQLIAEYGGYSFLKNTIPNLFGAAFKEQFPEKVEALIEAGKQFSNEALQQYYFAMMNRTDTTAVIKGSKVPVLFILGTEDVAAPLNDVLQQAHLANCSYIHILNNVGHMGMWEATDKVNNHFFNFINR
jgi:pimeloyl-ACP methyl ester carboxylesterase